MIGLEIVLILLGAGCIAAGFFIPKNSKLMADMEEKKEEKHIEELIEKEIAKYKESLKDSLDEEVKDYMEKAERGLERISNDKIMAVNEYSDTVLNDINKNHEEAVFLYNMLNDKHNEILNSHAQIESASKEVKETLKAIEAAREEANADEEDDVSNRSDLVLDSELTTAACIRALELAYSDSFSHERPDGRNCFSVLNDLGIGSMARAENISESYSAKSTAEAWKNSSSHYKNMINPRFTKVGIGVANYNGSNYWVQIFTD